MRSLLLVAVMASSAHAQQIDPHTGWCPSAAPPIRPTYSKHFEIRADSFAVKPMRKGGFDSYQGSYARFGPANGNYLGTFVTAIEHGKLQFVQQEQWCKDMRVARHDPCDGKPNHIVMPRKILYEEAVPAGACIGYAVGLIADAFAVGLDGEMRAYTHDAKGTIRRAATLKTPRLEVVERVQHGSDGRLVLQEPSGPLWTAHWDGKRPILERVTGITDRVLSFVRANDNHLYAITDSALYKLDRTYAVKWKLAGEVWGFINQDVPERSFVLVVDRSKPKPRVVLKLVGPDGKTQRETVVYEGPVSAAEINGVQIGYVVFVAT